MSTAGEVTVLLGELKRGRKDALDRLIPLVYKELRYLAACYMRRERTGHTLQPTALVHEAFLRLVNQNRDEVLARLNQLDPQQAQVVEMRYFGGLSEEETAEAMGISARTVRREWVMAKSWLREQLTSGKVT